MVGEFGRQYFSHRGVPVEKSFLYTAQNPTLRRAREIANLLVELFDRGELDEIFVVYTDFKSGREEEVIRTQLLPLHRSDFSGGNEASAHFEYEPSAAEVLDNVVLSLVTGFVYSALVDSYCSEQNARMDAMSTADQNADELLKALSLEFNRARQAAITQEITEVSSGAKGMKRKKC